EDEVEHQGGNRQLGQGSAHGFFHDTIDAAADEEGAALDVDGPDRVGEQHHRQDEPGRRGTDALLDDAADVIGGRGQVAEHHGSGLPVGDEGERHAADHDRFRGGDGGAGGGGGLVGRGHTVGSRR